MTALLLTAGVFLLLALRVPIAIALLVPCMVYIANDPIITLGIALQRMTGTLDSFALLAVPLFILVGFLADAAGLADRLVNTILALMGRLRASLAYVNVTGCFVFSWMSGSSMADAAAMGRVMIPTMRKYGYDPGFAAGLTAAGAMIGPIMPPSLAAIFYAVIAGTSIGAMFLAGVLPAVLILLALYLYIFFYARKHPELSGPPRMPIREAAKTTVSAVPILVLPVIILGGILGGLFTATEAAAVAVAYLVLMALAARWLKPNELFRAFSDAAYTTSRVMFIAAAGGLYAYVLSREGAGRVLAERLISVSDGPLLFLLILNVALLIAGMILDGVPALLITVPVVLPAAIAYGIDPIHLGIIMTLNLTLGMLTPPVALTLNVISTVSGVRYRDAWRGTYPLFVPLVAVLLLVTYVPAVSTWLPSQLL